MRAITPHLGAPSLMENAVNNTAQQATDVGNSRNQRRTSNESELGWDGIIADYPQAETVRIPLSQGGSDAGVLVLDHARARDLADALYDLLGQNGGPASYQWTKPVRADTLTGGVEIPIGRAGNYVGIIKVPFDDATDLRDEINEAVARVQQAKHGAGKAASRD